MANGATWDPNGTLPNRPGLYLNFQQAAIAAITGGPRGVVALPLFEYGTAEADKFHTFKNEDEVKAVLGSTYDDTVLRVLEAGAKEVLVYTVPPVGEGTAAQQYTDMRTAFEARPFNVFVFPDEVTALEQDNTLDWCQQNRTEGKHFLVVFGGSDADDQDPTVGNARSVRLKDDYAVNLITGVELNDGTTLNSSQYASYIAGLIASTPINKAITKAPIPVADVTKRLRNAEISTALNAGSLVLVYEDGEVVVEQGVVTNSNEEKRGKIRIIRARQAIATDIPGTARKNFLREIDNTPAGRASLVSAIELYLETLGKENVLTGPEVAEDPQRPPVGDAAFFVVSYIEVDSLERVFLTINV